MSESVVSEAQRCLKGLPIVRISQGAEAVIFSSEIHPYLSSREGKPKGFKNNNKYIIKFRPKKPYRHPKLDAQITKHRTIAEAKILSKLNLLKIKAPKLITVEPRNGIIWMEFVGGYLANGEVSSLKNWLWFLESEEEEDPQNDAVKTMLMSVGNEIGQLHINEIIHGDLTSSNIMLQKNEQDQWEPTLIDFGLSSHSGLPEDKAVDLYVIERALLSTHPAYAKEYNDWLLIGYTNSHQNKGKVASRKVTETLRRLEDVRLRGRKRSMLG